MRAQIRIVEPEGMAVVTERLINAFPWQQTCDTIEELLETMFSTGSTPRLYNEDPRLVAAVKL
jgi:hypothetical protein